MSIIKNMKKYSLLILCIIIFSCKKNEMEDRFDEEVKNLVFPSAPIRDSLFFSGKFNDKQFNLSNGLELCSIFGEPSLEIITQSFTFTTGDTGAIKARLSHLLFITDGTTIDGDLYKPRLSINSPNEDKQLPFEEIFDKAYTIGEKKIRALGDAKTTGFNLQMNFNYQLLSSSIGQASYNGFVLTSEVGAQDENAKLVIENVKKFEQTDRFIYLIRGHFNCKLYHKFSTTCPAKLAFDVKGATFYQRATILK
jgi:hypothetical protein